jgi:CHAT domain-containing protein
VENIHTTLQASNCRTTLLTGREANEESFTSLSSKPNNIIHLATHGFFWHEDVAKEKDVFKQYDSQNNIDPLSRCGLLFAGANMAYTGNANQLPEGVQDGILTAREISMMDFSLCDLVVLSACETGVGEYSTDGTFGLQRAFKQAGVQSIIMTLWPVNDSAAQLMMTEFYNNWIGKHQSKREAFRNAQNTVRSQYEEPEYWAGFIMLD